MENEDWEISSEEANDSELFALDKNDNDDDEQYLTSADLPKLQLRKNISKARWNDEMGMAEVVENKGKMWRTMGVIREGTIFFWIEETLFLAERGELDLSYGNESSVPLKDIYKKIAEGKNGCCYDYFEVFRYLRSLGYIVGRHSIPWTMRSNTKKSASVDGNPETKVIPNQNFEEPNLIHAFGNMGISDRDLRPAFDVYPPNSNFRKSCPGEPSFGLCIISGDPPSTQEVEKLERQCGGIPLKVCHVEPGHISFFSFNKLDIPFLP